MIIQSASLLEGAHTVDAIVFDFGGVLLDLYPERTFQQLSELTQIDLSEESIPPELLSEFLRFEKGLSRIENLIWAIQNASRTKPHPRPIIDAWNAMLGEWKNDKLNLLLELNQTCNCFLLSNTNQLHIDKVRSDFNQANGYPNFENKFFTKAYYSHQIHLRKPEKEIFQMVTQDADLNPSTTLFLDDSLENIKAASEAGWLCIHHPRNAPIEYLRNLIRL